ncbi:helicase [Corynebacterium aquilae DSM 44791]|uniref:Helicase n=1 Tax=Corynebacterium aquilae DSM 44791 TaxID=1431546 RepID=A0A1L7CFR6_9CORY|nr:helicase [Corynebacterium aquilae DSM 44791]
MRAQSIAEEQAYVDELFGRLDNEIRTARQRLADVQAAVDTATPDAEALITRETEYHGLNEKLDRLTIAQLGLVFGQITVDATDQQRGLGLPVAGFDGLERRYIGRMGIDDRADNYRTLLLDWRAPAARPFYLATTAQPEGVHMRRHIRTTGRKVTGVDDEILQGTFDRDGDDTTHANVVSERALYRALVKARTAHMPTIVETIQQEQDAIIRDATRKVMVVEGGPGTGKTAVALHRVAYLLYTWREQLEKTGVLIIGPNEHFLEYISRVLPELGETGVVLTTIGSMYPGIRPTHPDTMSAAEIKGSLEMVYILKQLVNAQQTLAHRTVLVDRTELTITESMVKKARTRARRSRLPHNKARGVFANELLDQLARHYGKILFEDPLGPTTVAEAEVAQLHDDLAEVPAVSEFIDECWPLLNPTDLLSSFLGDAEMIDAIAHEYDEDTRAALVRPRGDDWSTSDAALLDELAELIGVPDEQDSEDRGRWHAELDDAQEALDILSSSASQDLDDGFDAEILQASDVIDAETLAQRQQVRDHRTTAQRAAADQRWAYGHVIVDEAQELTPMEWRMVMRRCPSRWMTLVGDTAQTGAPAGVDSWQEALEPFISSRFVHHELTVNYRTPAEIMEVASPLLSIVAPEQTPARPIREGGPSTVSTISFKEIGSRVAELRAADEQRRIAVIHPTTQALSADDKAALATLDRDFAGEQQTGAVTVSEVSALKGLEFDHVILVDPAGIVEGSPQGWQDLYVALTRATQTLTLVGEMPEVL